MSSERRVSVLDQDVKDGKNIMPEQVTPKIVCQRLRAGDTTIQFGAVGGIDIVEAREWIVGEEQHGDIGNETGDAGYANRKEPPWGLGNVVVVGG